MKRIKFIVSCSYRLSMDYVRKKNFRRNDFKIVSRGSDLRGYDPNEMEFILLEGYCENEIFRDYFLYVHDYLKRGATLYYDTFADVAQR